MGDVNDAPLLNRICNPRYPTLGSILAPSIPAGRYLAQSSGAFDVDGGMYGSFFFYRPAYSWPSDDSRTSISSSVFLKGFLAMSPLISPRVSVWDGL